MQDEITREVGDALRRAARAMGARLGSDWKDDYVLNNNWGHKLIQLPEAWEDETGNSNAKIAILDSGFDTEHEDLEGNIVYSGYHPSLNSITGTRHGTRVTGIAGAEGDNGIGLSGVCWDCELYLYRWTDGANGSAFVLADSIIEMVKKGAIIINISQGVERGYEHVCSLKDVRSLAMTTFFISKIL